MTQPIPVADERSQLSEKLWTYAQRAVVLFVCMGAGVFIGYQMWGEAIQLREDTERLEEKATMREKERDTLKSQIAIIDRDKKELEKKFQDLQARCVDSGANP